MEKKIITLKTADELDVVRIFRLFERYVKEKSPEAINAVGFRKHAFHILLDMICGGYCYKAEMGDRLIAVVSYCVIPGESNHGKKLLKAQFSYELPSYTGFHAVDKLVEKAHLEARKYNFQVMG